MPASHPSALGPPLALTASDPGSTPLVVGLSVGLPIVILVGIAIFMRRRAKRSLHVAEVTLKTFGDRPDLMIVEQGPYTRSFDVFISHYTKDDSHDVYKVVEAALGMHTTSPNLPCAY